MPEIFLSYRREDAAGRSGRVYDRLASEFGSEHVFRDIDALGGGEDYADRISRAVKRCDAFIAVIGDTWLTVEDESRHRRLDNPDDWVRLELKAALESSVTVIPVLVGKAEMPRRDQLPEDIQRIAALQAREIRDTGWNYGVNGLIRDLGGRTWWHRIRLPASIAAAVLVLVACALVVLAGGDDSTATGTGSTSTYTDCGDGVRAETVDASCEFARNVANEYRSKGGPETLQDVRSPVTNYKYDLNCTAGPPAVCTTFRNNAPGEQKPASVEIE